MPSITPPVNTTTDVQKTFEISPILLLFLIIGIACLIIVLLAIRDTKRMNKEDKPSDIAGKVPSITETKSTPLNELETHLLDHFRACDLNGKAEILTFAAQVRNKKK